MMMAWENRGVSLDQVSSVCPVKSRAELQVQRNRQVRGRRDGTANEEQKDGWVRGEKGPMPKGKLEKRLERVE